MESAVSGRAAWPGLSAPPSSAISKFESYAASFRARHLQWRAGMTGSIDLLHWTSGRVRMRGELRMRQQGRNLSHVRAEGDEQDPAGEGKVLEEVPEQVARPAAARAPKVARL